MDTSTPYFDCGSHTRSSRAHRRGGIVSYAVQEYTGFPPTNIRNGGKFHGLMLEGVIGF